MALLHFVTKPMLLLLGFLLIECSALPAQYSDDATHATSFDFIVVGGGTAGNAVATRLSQQLPDCSILVIEAGPFAPYEDRINILGMKGSTLGTKYDWNFTLIPQPQLYNRVITQLRGKVLGGTAAINLLIWDRGSKPEYDAWGEVGNPGWSWDSMIHVMNKAENFTSPGAPNCTTTADYGVADR